MANNFPNNFVFWAGGNGDWFSGWTPNGVSVPDSGTDAIALQQNITITFTGGSGAAESLSMQGGSTGLGASSAVVAISGGSLALGRGSPAGNITQTGGTLVFHNGLPAKDGNGQRTDHIGQPALTDFSHAGEAGASSTIYNLNQSAAGTIMIDSGALHISGNSSDIAGTIGGKGTLADPVAGVVKLIVDGIATLEAGAILNVNELDVTGTNATLTLGGDRTFGDVFVESGVNAAVQLNGHTLRLNGQVSLGDGIRGPGTMIVGGSGSVHGFQLGNGAVLDVEGTLTQSVGDTSQIGFSDTDTAKVQIGAGGVWNITTDVGIRVTSAAEFDNAGLLRKSGGAGTTNINLDTSSGTFNNTGTIQVDTGILNLGSGTYGGHLTGAGQIFMGGHATLASGVNLDVATFKAGGTGASLTLAGNVTYGGSYSQSGVNFNLNLNGHTFSLGGPVLLADGIVGPGTIVTAGSGSATSFVLGAGAILDVEGTIAQSVGGTSQIGTTGSDTAAVHIGAAGIWNITTDLGIRLNAAAEFDNAGLLEKIAGAGTTDIGFDTSSGVVNNAGTVRVGSGTLQLGTVHNSGTMEADAGTTLRLGRALANDGEIRSDGGTVNVQNAVAGTGHFLVQHGGSLNFSTDVEQNVVFAGGNGAGSLSLNHTYGGTISGFSEGDSIDLKFLTFDASLHAVATENAGNTGATLSILNAASATVATINLAGPDFGSSQFNLADDQHGGTSLSGPVALPPPPPPPPSPQQPHWLASVDVGAHPAGWLPSGTGDFNADGFSDLLWYNSSNRDIDVWKLANGAWAGSIDAGSHPAGYQPAGFGDLNGDGTSDVIWFNPTTRDVDLWKISNGQWAGSVDTGTHPAGYTPTLTGDFNGDGTGDIVWYNAATRDVDLWKIANGQWAGSVDIGTHPAGYTPALSGDFNGDGTSDIAWYNPTTGDVDIWKISNGQWAGSVSVGSHPAGWQPLGAADFNKDGTSDIAWYNPTTNDIDIWLIKNGQWAGSVGIGTHPAGSTAVGVGDFDHNGVSDIAWFNPTTSHIENWLLASS
jgi:hypothetical protein